MKRVLLSSLFIGLVGLVAVAWLAAPRIAAVLRARLETALSAALGVPVRVDAVRLSAVPLGVGVAGLRIGGETPIAAVGHFEAHLGILASVAQRRPVVDGRIDALSVDLTHLPPSTTSEEETPFPLLPALLLRDLEVGDAHLRFRMGKSVAHLSIARLVAQAGVGRGTHELGAAVEATGITFERKGYQALVHVLRAEGRAGRDGFFIDRADLEGENILARGRPGDAPGTLRVAGTLKPALLGVVVDELAFVDGEVSVDGALVGDLRAPVLDVTMAIADGAIASHRLGDLVTHLYWAGTTMRFGDLQLVGTAGRVRGNVDLTIVHEVPLHGELEWDNVDLAGLLRVIGPDVPFAAGLFGRTTVHGALDPMDLLVAGDGRLVPHAPSAPATFDLSGRVQAHDLDARLEVAQPLANQVETHLILAHETMGGTIGVRAADLEALGALLPQPVRALGLAGVAEATATYGGTTDHPEIRGDVTVRNGAVGGVGLGRVQGDFVVRRGRLETTQMVLTRPDGGAAIQGAVALVPETDNDWRVRLEGVATDPIVELARRAGGVSLPVDGGSLDGALSCRGPWRSPDLGVDIVARGLSIAGEPLVRLAARGSGRWPQWTLQAEASRDPDELLTVRASGESDQRLDLAVESTAVNLATLRTLQGRAVRGRARLEGHVRGSPARPDGTVQLFLDDLAIADRVLGTTVVRGDGAAGQWTLRSDLLDDHVHVEATVGTDGARPYRAALRWVDADLTGLAVPDGALQVRSTGELSLAGTLQALGTPSGTLQVTRFEAYHEPIRFAAAEPILVRFDRGQVRIDSLALESAEGRVAVTGGGRLPVEFDLDVRGQGDLIYLDVLVGSVSAARGTFDISAHIAHRRDTGWALSGGATVRDAALDFGLPVAFTDVEATLQFTGASVEIVRLDGRAGGGDFDVTGRVDLDQGPALGWSMREVSFSLADGVNGRVSGRGQVTGSWRVLTVGGRIEVDKAVYDQPIELADFLPWFREQVRPVPRTKPPATEVRLDVTIAAPDGLFVDNNVAKVESRADLHLLGPTDKPALLGRVEVLDGEATFREHRFTITSGSLIFDDPERINPRLEFSAESLIVTSDADYVVTAVITGTADAPRVRFEADDPRLSQNDVLSLVTFGYIASQNQRVDGGPVGVGDVVGLLPGDVRTGLRSLGVDRFEVEPAYVRSTGAVEPRVSIGKDLTSRLRALASSSFGVDPRNTMQLEYRVTGRVSLLGDWESRTKSEAGAFGGDIRFRYGFRRLPFSLVGPSGAPAGTAP